MKPPTSDCVYHNKSILKCLFKMSFLPISPRLPFAWIMEIIFFLRSLSHDQNHPHSHESHTCPYSSTCIYTYPYSSIFIHIYPHICPHLSTSIHTYPMNVRIHPHIYPHLSISGWWFGTSFIFPDIGNHSNCRTHIFQRGRLHHSPYP